GTAQTGTTAPNWWVHIFTTAAGTDANHWELGYNSSNGVQSTVVSGNGSTGAWSASTVHFYFRVSAARTNRKWHLFTMQRALYAVEEKADGTTGVKLFINGDRGICSSGTPGTTAVINDSSKNWATNRWAGARVAIIEGPGAGQNAAITASNTTSLTVSLDIAPTSLSEYYIYDTNEWTEISTAIFDTSVGDTPVRDVTVGNGISFFAFGGSTVNPIGSFTWNTSVHAGFAVSSFGADHLDFFSDPSKGPQIIRTVSSQGRVSNSTITAFGTTLKFSTGTKTGGTEYPFTNLIDYNNQMYAFKEDSIWIIRNDRAEKLNVGLDAFPSSHTGRAAAAQNLFLLFSWSHSVERLHGGQVTDIGLWSGAGLKDGHQGPMSGLVPYIAWTLGAKNAGTTGLSAAYAWNNRGWHEFFRGHTTGYQLQDMYMQNNPGGNPRLWFSYGGELICQRWPRNTLNPRNDGNIHYQHEALFETGIIDMNAVQLKKLFSQTFAVSKNLASTQAVIYAEYQLEDDINSTNWLPIGDFRKSPIDNLRIGRGDKTAIRLRFRGVTMNSTIHTELQAVVLKAVARTPVRRQWTIRAVTGDFQVDAQGLEDADPDDFYMWLQDAAVTSEPLLMHAAWETMDGVEVYMEHP
ncbi:hypothetical protein LCGC14_2185020, partial [marine sediment metagenome]